MEIVRPANEDEMILAFLEAEKDAPRVDQPLLRDPGVRALIEDADLGDVEQNVQRGWILGSFRGYPSMLFRRFPNDVEWDRVRLTLDELRCVKYAAHQTWIDLSGGTRVAADGAANYGIVPLPARARQE